MVTKFAIDREALRKADAIKLVLPGGAFTGTYGPRGQVPGTTNPTGKHHNGLDIARFIDTAL